jgi:Uma2 family endonuclease
MSTTATPPAVITPDDLLRMPDEGAGYELVNGELKELNMSAQSWRVGGRLYNAVENFCSANGLGWVFPQETGFRCHPTDRGRVRKPDTAYIALPRMTQEQFERDGFIEVVPDLVAEVISPTDNARDLEEKLDEWLAIGVKVVWVVAPSTRTIRVHRADGGYAFLRAADTLTGDPVLPGFVCPVADLFRLPTDPAPAPAA